MNLPQLFDILQIETFVNCHSLIFHPVKPYKIQIKIYYRLGLHLNITYMSGVRLR